MGLNAVQNKKNANGRNSYVTTPNGFKHWSHPFQVRPREQASLRC